MQERWKGNLMMHYFEELYLKLGLGIFIYSFFLHPFIFPNKMHFLPLMIYSLYGAVFN
jgi:hypothetical protein